MDSNEGIQVCPVCKTSTNSRGESLVSDHAVACHIAGKCQTGDRAHRSWALNKSPVVNFKASIPQIANIIEWVVVEARQERIQNVLKNERIRTPYDKITDIEKRLHNFIRDSLIKEFGDSEQEWWVQGVPLNVRMECQVMCERDNRKNPPYNYTYLINLIEILDKNWNIFEPHYQCISTEYRSKREFLNCLNKLNNIRNTIMHPIREQEGIPEDDSQFLDSFCNIILEFSSNI
jgi:hypothetical protein